MARIGETSDLLKCSFCGKSQKQVKKLIAGPGVYICDECIELCNEIIEEEMIADPSAGDGGDGSGRVLPSPIRRLDPNRAPIRVLRASEEELAAHAVRLAIIEKSAGGPSLWAKMEAPAEEPAS